MKSRQDQRDKSIRARLEPEVQKFEKERNAVLAVYEKNRPSLARELEALFTYIPELGPRDIHTRALKLVQLLCPNDKRLWDNVARVLLTQAQTTTHEDLIEYFEKEMNHGKRD